MIGDRSKYDIGVLRKIPYALMTRGERTSAAKMGIIPHVRSHRERQLRRRYRMFLEDYDRILAEQNGGCGVCGIKIRGVLNVDHNHVTGQVRGLVCNRCNLVVGMFESPTDVIAQVAGYLAEHNYNRLRKGTDDRQTTIERKG